MMAAADSPIDLSHGLNQLDAEGLRQLEAAHNLNLFKWDFYYSSGADENLINIYYRANTVCNSSVICGKTRMAAPAERILAEVTNPVAWKTWDPMLASCKTKQLDDIHTIVYMTFTAIWPAWPRDLVYLQTKQKKEDGTIAVTSRTTKDDDFPLDDKNYVRAELYAGGWYIKPVPGNPNACDITYYMNMDPKTNIVPTFLLTMGFPAVIEKVRAAVTAKPAQ